MARPPRPSLCEPRILGAALGILGATLGLVTACFDGADALHLPCDRDEDCGRGQDCVVVPGAPHGFCDGPPDTGVDPTGTSVADTGSGSSTSAGESGSSTGDPPLPVCGDGEVGPGEDCDDGEDSAACNSAPGCEGAFCCRASSCGDGYVNPATEMCEGDADCRGCLRVILHLGGDETDAWTEIGYEPPEALAEPLPSPTGTWDGWVFDGGLGGLRIETYPPAAGSGGVTYATTPMLDLSAPTPEGVRYQLRLVHAYAFDGDDAACGPTAHAWDGGHVQVLRAGSSEAEDPTPSPPYGGNLERSPADSGDCNGIGEGDATVPAFTFSQEELETVFPLDAYEGDTIQAMLVARFNCEGNCWPDEPPGAGWQIFELEVAAVPE